MSAKYLSYLGQVKSTLDTILDAWPTDLINITTYAYFDDRLVCAKCESKTRDDFDCARMKKCRGSNGNCWTAYCGSCYWEQTDESCASCVPKLTRCDGCFLALCASCEIYAKRCRVCEFILCKVCTSRGFCKMCYNSVQLYSSPASRYRPGETPRFLGITHAQK